MIRRLFFYAILLLFIFVSFALLNNRHRQQQRDSTFLRATLTMLGGFRDDHDGRRSLRTSDEHDAATGVVSNTFVRNRQQPLFATTTNSASSSESDYDDDDDDDGVYDCASSRRHVRLLDRGPFARGFSKSVWRVVDTRRHQRQQQLQQRVFVLKTVVESGVVNESRSSVELRDAFLDGVRRELKMLDVLRQANLSNIAVEQFGQCLSLDDNAGGGGGVAALFGLFVEGPLHRWEGVVRSQRLPWCIRLQLAYSLARLLLALEQKHLVHCDWKSDQVAIRIVPLSASSTSMTTTTNNSYTLEVRLVDLKSLKWFKKDTAIGRGVRCNSDSDCVQECFRWQYESERFVVPDYRCERTPTSPSTDSGKCIGIDSSSMIFATQQLFFGNLLLNTLNSNVTNATYTTTTTTIDSLQQFPAPLADSIRYVASNMASTRSSHRMSARRLVEKLQALMRQHGATKCLRSKHSQSVLRGLIHSMDQQIAGSINTCSKYRYC